GRGPGSISPSVEAVCACAGAISAASPAETMTPPTNASAAALSRNSRRVMVKIRSSIVAMVGSLNLGLWQWGGSGPSRPFDGGTESRQGVAQALIGDRRQAFGCFRHRFGARAGLPPRRRPTGEWRLAQHHPSDRAPAEEAVDPFQDDG